MYSKLPKEFAIIIGIYCLGELISNFFGLSLPGSIVGLILLIILILSGIIKISQIEQAAHILLDNMGLFFVPPAVGLMLYFGMLSTSGLAIITVIFFSTMIVLVLTGKTVDILINSKEGNKK